MTEFPDWMLHFAHLETAKRHSREAVTEHYRSRLLVDESPKFDTAFSAGKLAALRYLAGSADE